MNNCLRLHPVISSVVQSGCQTHERPLALFFLFVFSFLSGFSLFGWVSLVVCLAGHLFTVWRMCKHHSSVLLFVHSPNMDQALREQHWSIEEARRGDWMWSTICTPILSTFEFNGHTREKKNNKNKWVQIYLKDMTRFTVADFWVTYFSLLKRVKYVLALSSIYYYYFFLHFSFSVLLFKCEADGLPTSVAWFRHWLVRLQTLHALKLSVF